MMENNHTFDFVSFPNTAPHRETLQGHNCLLDDRYHGSLQLELIALTPVSISAGITAMGSDVEASEPLIRVMEQNQDGKPILQGTSLKGCIRAVYEAITVSTAGVKGKNLPGSCIPTSISGKAWERRSSQLSPAELVFGALGFQGLVSIADAEGDRPLEVGLLPAMYQPKHGNGRKFYYHQIHPNTAAKQSANTPDRPPFPIQQAPKGSTFKTTLRFTNLTLAQLGTLFTALGLHPEYRFCLKVGAGKGKGLGSMKVALIEAVIVSDTTLQERYLDYQPTQPTLSLEALFDAAIESSTMLLVPDQLNALKAVLQYPEAAS